MNILISFTFVCILSLVEGRCDHFTLGRCIDDEDLVLWENDKVCFVHAFHFYIWYHGRKILDSYFISIF